MEVIIAKNVYLVFGDHAYILLTQGKVGMLDTVDIPKVKEYRWRAFWSRYTWYVITTVHSFRGPRSFMMHRLILDTPQNKSVDHRNHNGLVNNRFNIRHSDAVTNKYNSRPYNNLKYKGIAKCWWRNPVRYQARITVDKKRISLGYYFTEIDAARAYNKAAIIYHKEFAYLNPIKED